MTKVGLHFNMQLLILCLHFVHCVWKRDIIIYTFKVIVISIALHSEMITFVLHYIMLTIGFKSYNLFQSILLAKQITVSENEISV